MIARTPKPPYYAVIFTSLRSKTVEGYDEMSRLMMKAVTEMEGFLGVESACEEVGITVSYWSDIKAILSWRNEKEHQKAQTRGREQWYDSYQVRIAKVERDYYWKKDTNENIDHKEYDTH